jgi:hypothetical protein
MPVTSKTISVRASSEAYSSSGAFISSTPLIYSLELHRKETPTTVTRPRPLSFFEASTGRRVVITTLQDSLADVWNNDKRNVTRNMPVSNHYLIGNIQAPAVTAPSSDAIYNSIRNQMRGDAANLAMALAEYNKTARLFADAARFVASKGRGFARGFAGTKKASRTVAKRYLEYQYGIKPLCTDMVSSYNTLKEAAMAKPLVIGGRKVRVARAVHNTIAYPNSTQATRTTMCEVERVFTRRVTWRATLNPDGLRSTLARHGFSNPISLGYELIPYSFVLDWWINVGDVLASLDNLTLVKNLHVRDSLRTVTVHRLSAANSNCVGSYTNIHIDDTRGVVTEISRINTLQYKPSVSLTHILNGLALLRTAKRD